MSIFREETGGAKIPDDHPSPSHAESRLGRTLFSPVPIPDTGGPETNVSGCYKLPLSSSACSGGCSVR